MSVLSAADIEHFITRGYVVVPECFSRELARQKTDEAFRRLGYDKHDRSTWKRSRIHMALGKQEDLESYSPRAFAAAAQLVGGAERIVRPMLMFTEGFIANLNDGADRLWQPPSAELPGWHKDGNWFVHFLDSPEQGLLMIFIYSDIAHRGGGTFIAPDSVGVVARFFAKHPEGVEPNDIPCRQLIAECREFVELTGRAGDVVLMHPYMLHCGSQNHSPAPRFITNPSLFLREPMRFDRDNPADFSPVERAVLRGLGVERFEFRSTRPRRRIVSEQEKMQEQLKAEERANLTRPA
jgi:ectoine hydroxylase-related dioxygenase (phytanoyl-CoA dioxygenase family)